MPLQANFPCFTKMGSVGTSTVYGRNEYGPWIASKKWTPENKAGSGGLMAYYVQELVVLWNSLTSIEKVSWLKLARKLKITNYMAFLKVNIPLKILGLEPRSIPE